LQCLKALLSQNGLGDSYSIEVFLVDDGCTDGTPEAIVKDFPQVNIIQGNGELYWNRGMLLAWETAKTAKDFDYYLWLNDDTFLFDNAFEILLHDKFPESIICGSTISQVDHNTTYGGFINNPYQLLNPNSKYQNSDYCNGNCVIIPKKIFKKIGLLDPFFHHALGDFDYSRRAIKSGFKVLVAPDYIGTCEKHDFMPKWLNTSYNFIDRLKFLYIPLSGCNPFEFFVLDWRSNGLLIAIFHFFSIHFKAIFPRF
jgi:GT2 family glycosyltransferase